jgi:hypothetical protein
MKWTALEVDSVKPLGKVRPSKILSDDVTPR